MPEQTAKKMTDKKNTGSVGSVPVRLDVYVAECEGVTRSAAQRLIESGCVTVGGRVRDKKYLVTDADEVTVELPEPQPCEAQPQDIPLDIVCSSTPCCITAAAHCRASAVCCVPVSFIV